MPTTTISTTLLESVNIVLANLGESPVNTLSGGALPQQVSLALNTIEEVSTDIQSKGWWFNQQTASAYSTTANVVIYPSNTANDWGSSIPEEARRYITIRASRIAQTRLIGSEELQKFSYNEELVSLAILQQAHVRNSGGVLDFNDFPAELRGLGMDEVMFLQGNVEEKIGTLRLGGELANIAKTKAETSLIADQEALITQQALTEAQNTNLVTQNAIKVAAEAGVVTSQQALIAQQVLDVVADTAIKGSQKLKIDEEKLLVTEQKTLVTKQALTEVQNAIKVSADSGLITAQQALVSQQVLDAAADIALKGKQGSLVDTQALDVAADTALKSKQGELVDAQATTEAQNAIKVAVDAGLVTTQQALVAQQVLESVANVSNITADVALKGKQSTLVEKQALDVAADTALKGLQGSLVGAQTTDVAADTSLKGKQGTKIDAETGLTTQQQALTAQQTLDVVADTSLKGKQGALVDTQATDVAADTTLKGKQADLLESQKTQLDAQTAIEATAEKAFFDGVVAVTQNTYRDFAAEMRMMGIQEVQFQGTPAYKKIELLSDAGKLRTATATETGSDATELSEVNKVMRFIGEAPVTALNSNSLASECVRLLRDTDKELQGRGWWFNTETDVELTANVSGQLTVPTDALSVELNDYATRIKTVAGARHLYDLKEKSYTSWSGAVKAKVIYERTLIDTPQKYLEYLSIRVAILLTELYPQSGVDIQRLPKMEQELRAYFKDREFDEANYSVFDNYDAASRIGIHRNYDLT